MNVTKVCNLKVKFKYWRFYCNVTVFATTFYGKFISLQTKAILCFF